MQLCEIIRTWRMRLHGLFTIVKNFFYSSTAVPPFRTLRTAFFIAMVGGSMTLSACANPHFFPYDRPLFSGMEHVKGTPEAQRALAEAKEDFTRALHDQEPLHARYVSTLPYSHSRVYVGNGYRLTIVHQDLINYQKDGPAITLDSTITGGAPYSFDEIKNTYTS